MRIGTRGSALALAQAKWVAERLSDCLRTSPEITVIETTGDRVTDRPLREIEGRGYFTKEIEEALLNGAIDIAVHSFKDMPSKAPGGLVVVAVTGREYPADLLIIRGNAYDPRERDLPLRANSVVGTSAVRRETQTRALRKDLVFSDLRGNVPTRLKKLDAGPFDAIFLASAGVRRLRLDLAGYHVIRLDPTRFIPAPGQGALAIQMREDDEHSARVRAALHDASIGTATSIERAVQARFGGGCGLPLGVYTYPEHLEWHAHGFWGGDPARPVWAQVADEDPERISERLFAQLKDKSA
ncbi:hydroxymethylbilane synthase [bacterium]|nr:hydroxymethylbilane synthase [bacterium]MBU1984652.1 hydroxymethylbilane synthase [bacterium]